MHDLSNYSFEETCIMKQSKQINISWEDIAEHFGFADKEVARQRWKYIRRKQNRLSTKDEFRNNSINLQIVELQKERTKLQDQRRELNKLIRESARFEYILEHITQVAEDIKKEKPLKWKNTSSITSEKEGVLLISDWHSNLEIDLFLNKFNKEEFRRRVNRLITKTVEYGKFNKIKTIHVFNLNDLVAGIIHDSARIQSNEDNISQLMYVSEIIAECLVNLANNFNNVKFYNVIDNHSRAEKDKNKAIRRENYSRIIPWYLKARLSNMDNIEIVNNDIDEEFAYANICGYQCLGIHGHNDKISEVSKNLSGMLNISFDYIFTSHYHHNSEDEVHSCDIVVNPSLVGVDEHSFKLRKTSKPAQKFMIFNKEEGREATYHIRLDI